MRIACLGGGPAGLYFAISMKLRDPSHDIDLYERNRPDDTFGWGVVFSDQTVDSQIFGGLGVTHCVPVERLYREIRALRIYEGASEVQKVVIARAHLTEFAA